MEIIKYGDIDEVVDFLAQGVKEIFGEELVGFYLTGSLSYGDFEPGRSDIDLAAVLEVPA
ncbi:MAG TPA: nucleotidyltransferase domain-containing protein, partial [Candidatus Pacearchaeota archaeon]|nr:nucleotidyltransferase domain-containing protein [Candidatus Pacearchaeota archaeon]